MPTAPPQPLPAFARTLFGVDDATRTLEHLFDYVYVFEPDETKVWRRFQLICENAASATEADDAVVTFDIVNYTGGNIDGTWDDGDYNDVYARLGDILIAYAPYMSPGYTWTTLKSYVMGFNPAWAGSPSSLDISPFMDSGGPEKVMTMAVNGAGTSHLPGQVSCSVTEEVPVRRAWGRFYLPFCGANLLEPTTGRFNTGSLTTIVTAVHAAYSGLGTAELYPIVVHTQQGSTKSDPGGGRVAAFSQVTHVKVDDVPDIIRRRRVKFPLFTARLPAAAALQPA